MFSKACDKIKSLISSRDKKRVSDVAVILGSGLGKFVDSVSIAAEIPYEKIPGFPGSTVSGHAGKLVLAENADSEKYFWIMRGRVHYYEGYSMEEVVFPVRVLSFLGVNKLLITNASGGVNYDFKPGDLMLLEDHINMFGENPLRGPENGVFGTRFPDMSEAYDKEISSVIENSACKLGIDLKKGVYFGWSGPCFETPAEVRMIRALGGDAVGMSTVPEVIAANHAGIRVAGISFVANKAAGMSDSPLTHEEVNENALKVEHKFAGLLSDVVGKLLK